MKNWVVRVAVVSLFLSFNANAGEVDDAKNAFNKKDYQAALKLWSVLVEQGNAEAMFNLGEMYLNGQGVAVDTAKGIGLVFDAAEKNYPSALSLLASSYEDDPAKAYPYWRRAADAGDSRSQYNVGNYLNFGIGGVKQNKQEAVSWYLKAAEQGYTNAQYNLGDCYQNGVGVQIDYVTAMLWFRKAAEKGMSQAQERLSIMYLAGQSVPQDYVESAKWQRKAAEQGLPRSQLGLGAKYMNGQGVPEDNVQAHKWVNLALGGLPPSDAAARSEANRLLGILSGKLKPAQVAQAQALAREWKPKKTELPQ